jgi:hypothetical protein
MIIDKDQVAEAGLFYCLPWMRLANAKIEQLEAVLRDIATDNEAGCACCQYNQGEANAVLTASDAEVKQ